MKDKLRICLIGQKIQVQSRSTDTGLLWTMAKGLTQKGHDVTIISTTSLLKKYEVVRDGIKAYYLYDGPTPSRSLQFTDAAYTMFSKLHKEKPFDLVHSIDDSAYKIGKNKKHFMVPVAYDIEAIQLATLFQTLAESSGSLISQIKTGLKIAFRFLKNYLLKDRPLLRTADGIFTTTPQQRILLERYYLYPDYHTYTAPYGINLSNLTEDKDESDNFKLKLNIPEESNIILALSDFTNHFELSPLLAAFEKIVLKNANTYLVLIGDGPRWKAVEYEVLKRVLSSRVIMTGLISSEDFLRYITNSKVYINLSAQSTGLEPSLIEAMAQKKIVIGSELSPIAEIIENKVDGFLVRPADEQSIARLLSQILQNEKDFTPITENARQKVLNVFNRDKMSDSLLDCYQQILQKNKHYIRRRKS